MQPKGNWFCHMKCNRNKLNYSLVRQILTGEKEKMNMNARNQYLKILESRLGNIKNVIIIDLVTILIKLV